MDSFQEFRMTCCPKCGAPTKDLKIEQTYTNNWLSFSCTKCGYNDLTGRDKEKTSPNHTESMWRNLCLNLYKELIGDSSVGTWYEIVSEARDKLMLAGLLPEDHEIPFKSDSVYACKSPNSYGELTKEIKRFKDDTNLFTNKK
jgi:hypothetical protein